MLWERVTADWQAREIRQTRPSPRPRERRSCGGFAQESFGTPCVCSKSGPVSITFTSGPHDRSRVSTGSGRTAGLCPHFAYLSTGAPFVPMQWGG